MEIQVIADSLCQKFGTRNPFKLAESLGIIVLFEPLGAIQGYYNQCFRQKFIHINQDLNEHEARFACAHELAHAVLHPKLNTPFLKRATLFSIDKLERQANCFALDVLYDDYDLMPFLERGIYDAAAYMGVPIPLAEYRMSSVQPTLW